MRKFFILLVALLLASNAFAITASYVSGNSFTVTGDLTASFVSGRKVKADCGGDGYKYSTVASSSYGTVTSVTLVDSVLTSNLVSVQFGVVSPGTSGSLPTHDHSDDNTGGSLQQASASVKGVASFSADDFVVSSGDVTLANELQTNLISNSQFLAYTNSELAQGTTGEQSNFELAAPDLDDDADSGDYSGSWSCTDCTMSRTSGSGAGGSSYYYTVTETNSTQAISRSVTVTSGKLYKVSVQIKMAPEHGPMVF